MTTGSRAPLLLHYHIFKNAGSSVDRMLAENFGAGWRSREFEAGTLSERSGQVRDLLMRSPDLAAFSSHTAPMPVPELSDRAVVPIIFVRHPLLRIRSGYAFHRRQADPGYAPTLARSTDLRGYVEAFLADPRARPVRNFQCARFATGTPGRPAQLVPRALATMARLPFVGLVEAYEESLAHLEQLVRPLLPGFQATVYRENTTTDGSDTIADALAAMRDEVGSRVFDRLLEENAGDLDLFERVRARYATAR